MGNIRIVALVSPTTGWLIVASLIFIVLLIAALLWAPIPHLFRLFGERKLRNLAVKNRIICLTYDDGPSQHLTGKLLELLESFEAPATFFLQGNKLDQTAAVNAIVEGGHEIGCHGFHHVNAWYASPLKSWQDMGLALRSFKERDLDSALIRPPYGKITCFSMLQVALSNKTFGWWTLDTNDTADEIETVDELLSRVSDAQGGVILFHDLDEYREKERIDFVLNATREILEFSQRNGYKVKTHSNLLGLS